MEVKRLTLFGVRKSCAPESYCGEMPVSRALNVRKRMIGSSCLRARINRIKLLKYLLVAVQRASRESAEFELRSRDLLL